MNIYRIESVCTTGETDKEYVLSDSFLAVAKWASDYKEGRTVKGVTLVEPGPIYVDKSGNAIEASYTFIPE